MRKFLMGIFLGTLFVFSANATKLDVIDIGSGTTVISLDLAEGETSGADSYINNMFSHDGTTGTRIAAFSPTTGDGDYAAKYWTGDGFFSDSHDAIYRVSGWTDYAPRGADVRSEMTGSETKFLALGKLYPAIYAYVPMFSNYTSTCLPTMTLQAVEFVGHPEINTDKVSIIGNILKIDLAGVVVNDGDTIVLNVDIKATNGYGNDTAKITINITPYAITIKTAVSPDGAVPDAGGVAEISVLVDGANPVILPVLESYEVRVGVPTKTTAIDLVATDDGVVYLFKDWTTGSFSSTATSVSTNFNELSGGSGAVSNITLTGTFEVINSKLFTAKSNDKTIGVVSPESKAVEDGGSVFFRATAICSTLKSAKYKPEDTPEVELDVSGFAGDYYTTKTWTVPVNGTTTAEAVFEKHGISDADMDDAKTENTPGNMPTPGSLSDLQLADLTDLLADRAKLDPATWQTAYDLYQDEIDERLDEINDLLATEGLDNTTKTALTDVKTVYTALGGTGTTPAATATTSTPTTTTIVDSTGEATVSDAESQSPAAALVGTGVMMLLGQERELYKPYWSTQRPDVPGEKK